MENSKGHTILLEILKKGILAGVGYWLVSIGIIVSVSKIWTGYKLAKLLT